MGARCEEYAVLDDSAQSEFIDIGHDDLSVAAKLDAQLDEPHEDLTFQTHTAPGLWGLLGTDLPVAYEHLKDAFLRKTATAHGDFGPEDKLMPGFTPAAAKLRDDFVSRAITTDAGDIPANEKSSDENMPTETFGCLQDRRWEGACEAREVG